MPATSAGMTKDTGDTKECVMKLNEISDNAGSRQARMRVGRGIGSGKGKTGGRGGKGQTARTGVRIKGFEGGQMPLHRRLPKRGFKNSPFARKLNEVNLGRVQAAIDAGLLDGGATVDSAALVKAGILRRAKEGVRLLGGGEIDAFGFLDQRAHPIDPAALVERASDRILDFCKPRQRDRARIDLLPAGGLFAQFGDVHVAEIGQHQRARDRRCREHEEIDCFALARQCEALMHAEAMLLVDDGQAEGLEDDAVFKKGVGSDDKLDDTVAKTSEQRAPLAGGQRAGALGHYQRLIN